MFALLGRAIGESRLGGNLPGGIAYPLQGVEQISREDDPPALPASESFAGEVIHPNGPRKGFEIEVKGKLAALIGGKHSLKPFVVGNTW